MSEKKKLKRSKTDKRIAGVCGGLAKYFDTDSTIVRIIFLVLLIMGGGGFLLYIIGIIAMPVEAKDEIPQKQNTENTDNQNTSV